uniref:Uncharacterized protein n=1 Tax=Aureoumbra lagunensis TaxID=44058 RepID=A0A7S3NIU0_9STRA|mmetsp:Transcript_15651/g.23567  ORF Transcript_15651/g.23567 Transcript_15651/m.23567 type:complete len:181 (+) Transcript_15651:49-591(+)
MHQLLIFMLMSSISGFISRPVRMYRGLGNVQIISQSRKLDDDEPPVIDALIAGDAAILVSSSSYQALIATLLSDDFVGWGAPMTIDSLSHIPSVLSTALFSAMLWIIVGFRHKVFSPAVSYRAILHAAVDAATLRVLLAIITIALTNCRIDITLLETSILANTLWILIWRLCYATFPPFM